ncbi:uncharacterized protein BDZ99DRAFT_545733 [Mytilinidion resinicola]|uniref:C3H1-type domain-containing protein n=1 Tax=Mytilinidion resinicola TaxID=574789 RepID=A0A6A6Y5Z9_9PEZI|nr:uncharacterized protein BDZ99DRAFT_545733 [Mytilinidion resinicola]KAF2803948.1 hypothetical protein BDZ99DRAFT_545733 [Mytilinidion resinicola]
MDLLASLIVPSQGQQYPLAIRPKTPTGPKSENPDISNRRTCFFWYHNGTCHRGRGGSACPFSHTITPGVPVQPPPGYFHRTPCTLPLCPLREDTPPPPTYTTAPQEIKTPSSETSHQSPTVSSGAGSPPTTPTGKQAKFRRWRERVKKAKQFEQERAGRILGLSPSQQQQPHNQTTPSPKVGQKRKHHETPEPLISLQGRGQNAAQYTVSMNSERKDTPNAAEEPEDKWHLDGFEEGAEAAFEGASKKRKMADMENGKTGGEASGKVGGTGGNDEWRGDWDTDYFRSFFGHPTP